MVNPEVYEGELVDNAYVQVFNGLKSVNRAKQLRCSTLQRFVCDTGTQLVPIRGRCTLCARPGASIGCRIASCKVSVHYEVSIALLIACVKQLLLCVSVHDL